MTCGMFAKERLEGLALAGAPLREKIRFTMALRKSICWHICGVFDPASLVRGLKDAPAPFLCVGWSMMFGVASLGRKLKTYWETLGYFGIQLTGTSELLMDPHFRHHSRALVNQGSKDLFGWYLIVGVKTCFQVFPGVPRFSEAHQNQSKSKHRTPRTWRFKRPSTSLGVPVIFNPVSPGVHRRRTRYASSCLAVG